MSQRTIANISNITTIRRHKRAEPNTATHGHGKHWSQSTTSTASTTFDYYRLSASDCSIRDDWPDQPRSVIVVGERTAWTCLAQEARTLPSTLNSPELAMGDLVAVAALCVNLTKCHSASVWPQAASAISTDAPYSIAP